ncbi:MAG: signal peptidase I [Mollicutes bacterium]|nr:signal peptidase I [Mollicutes bacterium]
MKIKDTIYLTIILIYILISQFILIEYESFFQYLINPLIWLVFLIIAYFLYHKNKHYYQYQNKILEISIMSGLLYNLLFYTLGYFTGYAHNAYSTTLSGIIINLFSIYLVAFFRNYLRYYLVNRFRFNFLGLIIITLIFFLASSNLPIIISLLKDKNNLFLVLIKYIIPVLSLETFLTYLNYESGLLTSFIYQSLLLLPSVIIPIIPDYNEIIPALFVFLFSLFTYIVIKNSLRKKDTVYIKEKPLKLIIYFILIIFIMMFSLGTFSIKPTVILTSSMKPSINKGDVALIKKCSIENISPGDIIEYESDNFKIVHRVIKVLTNYKRIELVLKGDNNSKEDKNHVTKDNLIGCYLLKIKYLGYPSLLIYDLFNKEEIPVETGR